MKARVTQNGIACAMAFAVDNIDKFYSKCYASDVMMRHMMPHNGTNCRTLRCSPLPQRMRSLLHGKA